MNVTCDSVILYHWRPDLTGTGLGTKRWMVDMYRNTFSKLKVFGVKRGRHFTFIVVMDGTFQQGFYFSLYVSDSRVSYCG